MSQDLLQVGLEGLRYLQTYDWLFLRTLVTLGYLGWIAFALTTVIDLHVLQNRGFFARDPATSAVFAIVFSGLSMTLWLRHAPYTYYLYAIFPVVFWEEVSQRRPALVSGLRILLADKAHSDHPWSLLLKSLAFVGLLEALVSLIWAHLFQRKGLTWLLRYYHTFTDRSTLSASLQLHSGQHFMAMASCHITRFL